MSKPLVVLDVIEPRKKILEYLKLEWKEEYKDFRVFREFLTQQIETNPIFADYKGKTDPCPYGFVGTTSCGTNQITFNMVFGSVDEEKRRVNFAKQMAWAVVNVAPNFIYWGGEDSYKRDIALLEDFGATYVMRSYNLVHNHFCREYHLSYDYADSPETKSTHLFDYRAYTSYSKLHLAGSKIKPTKVPPENYAKVD